MLKRFFLMAKPWWGSIFITVFSLLAAALLNLVTPELIRRMTALLATPDQLSAQVILTFVIILSLSYVLRAVMRFLGLWQAHVAAWNFVAEITYKVYEKLQLLSMRFFGSHSTGEIMSRTLNDTRNLEVLIAHAVPDMISSLAIILFVAVMIFTINPTLAALTLIPVPFVLLVSSQFSKRIVPLFRRNQEFLAELNSHLQDHISGMKEIKAFGREDSELKTMREFRKEYARVNIRANFANGIYQPSVEAVISMGTVIVMGVGGTLAMHNAMSTADIVGFFVYLSMFYQPLSTLARIVEDIQNALAGGERVLELLDTPLDIVDAPDAQPLVKGAGQVEFRDVSFTYDTGEKVLDGISFTAQPGQMVAIVGATGAGKTTVISLLERFYEPQKGCICIDGQDIKGVTVESLRQDLSIVLQDVFLFNGTVYDNIAYGREGAAREEVLAAARQARADDFIRLMPNGYETKIGERGARLSGGQKQRIAIARAILKNAPILILDEATSAVDNETEAQIQDAINALAGRHTLIVIAHRLTTVMKADNIIVLEHGQIRESGTHAQLLAQGGLYAAMCAVNDRKLEE